MEVNEVNSNIIKIIYSWSDNF